MPLDTPTHDEIIGLEKSYWDAIKQKDGKTTAALSGKTNLVIGVGGVIAVAKDKMAGMTEGGNWQLHSYAFENVQVITPAPDVAIIAYTVRQKMTMDGKSSSLHCADSSTWLRGADGWKCHAHSESYLQDAK